MAALAGLMGRRAEVDGEALARVDGNETSSHGLRVGILENLSVAELQVASSSRDAVCGSFDTGSYDFPSTTTARSQ